MDEAEPDACACMDCDDARRKKGIADGVRRLPEGGFALVAERADVVCVLALEPVSEERLGPRSGVRVRPDLTDGAGCGEFLWIDVRGEASLFSIGVQDSERRGDWGSVAIQFSESFDEADAGCSSWLEERDAMLCLLARGESGDLGG